MVKITQQPMITMPNNLKMKQIFMLNEKLLITHKVSLKDSVFVKEPMRKHIHYKQLIKRLLMDTKLKNKNTLMQALRQAASPL